MFDMLKGMFGGDRDKKDKELGKLNDLDRTRDLLNELKEAGCQLMLRFRGFEGSFTTSIVDTEKTSFLVDTLMPESGNETILKANDIYAETMLRGITCSFLTHFQGKVDHSDKFPALRLELPAEISRYQRREFFRIAPAHEATVHFLSPIEFTGPIFDISGGGLSFEYPASLGRLHVRDLISNMIVTIEDIAFATDCIVASNMISELGSLSMPLTYRCGIHFLELPAATQQDLQAYILKIQRPAKMNM